MSVKVTLSEEQLLLLFEDLLLANRHSPAVAIVREQILLQLKANGNLRNFEAWEKSQKKKLDELKKVEVEDQPEGKSEKVEQDIINDIDNTSGYLTTYPRKQFIKHRGKNDKK